MTAQEVSRPLGVAVQNGVENSVSCKPASYVVVAYRPAAARYLALPGSPESPGNFHMTLKARMGTRAIEEKGRV